MLVNRDVIVKVVVTVQYKQRLIEQLQTALNKVVETQLQMETQGKRYLAELESREPSQAEAFRRKLENQIRRQESVRVRLAERLVDAEKLEPGEMHIQGKLNGLVELAVGDNLSEKLHEAEILVKDDLIIEMRNV